MIRPVYVDAMAMISCCGALDDNWLVAGTHTSGADYARAVEPDVKGLLSPGELRRMSRILKRALATSLSVASSDHMPQAIITATGLGCMENSEKFLNEIDRYGEQMLKPTLFMQSTHNTIGSQIAITLGARCYNTTYSHKEISWESALADAWLQISSGVINSALVGAHDETTPVTAGATRRSSPEKGFISEGSVSAILSSEPCKSADNCLSLDSVNTLYRPVAATLLHLVKEADCDAVMLGITGYHENDRHYQPIIDSLGDKPVLIWKPILGWHHATSAQAFYIASQMLRLNQFPRQYFITAAVASIRSILIVNHSDGVEWGFTRLSVKP